MKTPQRKIISSSRKSAGSNVLPLDWLVVCGARQNNLKNIDVPFPLSCFTAVTGVSGSGKSSLINDILYNSLAKTLHRAGTKPGKFDKIEGSEKINKVIRVDQQPIGQTPTSNPATYTGIFDTIRDLFAQLPDARSRGFSQRRFSFNIPGGRCEKCEGAGQLKIEMHFLPDVWIECDVCGGKRYDAQTLEIRYKGYSIADILEMTCQEALEVFENIPPLRRTLQTLCDVGLDYLALGQSAPTLSGGESQRLKLASELSRPDTGRTLYLLDEPTTGLHFDDLRNLLKVLHKLINLGNTVVVIEHNLDIIKNADWVIDLGPEAGADGGYVVFAGTPEDMVKRLKTKSKKPKFVSHTADALEPVLAHAQYEDMEKLTAEAEEFFVQDNEFGKDTLSTLKRPWEKDGPAWHTQNKKAANNRAAKWEGKVLTAIVEYIEKTYEFAPTDWANRNTVAINSAVPSQGWFFHAVTAEEWYLKARFRTAKKVFTKKQLAEDIDIDNWDGLPGMLCCERLRLYEPIGDWQEIEFYLLNYREIDTPGFWKFLDTAIDAFGKPPKESASLIPKKSAGDVLPWKVLGEKWHSTDKGLIGGDKRLWNTYLLADLIVLIRKSYPEAVFDYGYETFIRVHRADNTPWLVLHTKNCSGLAVEFCAGNAKTFTFTKNADLRNKRFTLLLE